VPDEQITPTRTTDAERAARLLSQAHRAVLGARDEDELRRRLCRAVVDGTGLARADVVVRDGEGGYRTVASAGRVAGRARAPAVRALAERAEAGAGGVVTGDGAAAALGFGGPSEPRSVLVVHADDGAALLGLAPALEALRHDLDAGATALGARLRDRDAARRAEHLGRALLLLSRADHEIVRARDERQLFEGVCRVAARDVGFRLAWIGVEGDGRLLETVAVEGDASAYLREIRISVDADAPEGQGPSGRAFRSGRRQTTQDFLGDAANAPWHDAARRFGLGSSTALPIHRGGGPYAVLNVYAAEPEFFDEAVLGVLETLADDLSFALDALTARHERARAERDRKASERRARRLADVVEQSPSIVVLMSPDGTILDVNAAFTTATGYARDEALGRTAAELLRDPDQVDVGREISEAMAAGAIWRGEIRNRRKDGACYWEAATLAPVRDADGTVRSYTKLAEDITERKALADRLDHLARHDRLTGLPNRSAFLERIATALPLARRAGRHAAVLGIDLDNFKLVNETHGYGVGDRVLVRQARRLLEVLRTGDEAAHFGADEFWVLLSDLAHPQEAATVAERLREALSRPLDLVDPPVHPSASIGVTLAHGPDVDPEALLHAAERALLQAKTSAKGGIRFFEPEMNERVLQRMRIEQGMRRGLEAGEFRIAVQPRVRLGDGRLEGFEALLRWDAPDLGAVPPDRFVPVAEETGLIVPLGERVLDRAVALAAAWNGGGRTLPISVNLSAVQLARDDLPDRIAATLARHGLAPDRLHLEITETAVMADVARSADALARLRSLGVRIEVDDFGTGYSSLGYLRELPLDRIKVDRSFVADLPGSPDAAAIVRSMLALAEGLDLGVVAEGIETEEQRALLLEMGYREGQGWLFGRPDAPAAQARAWDLPEPPSAVVEPI
jgi:diguanylate cyclase (GGDEF)-like protein/PAS domain S-box-containing protein